jgi:hypothetical protein
MTSNRALEFARMCCSCAPREAVLIGTSTAPSQPQPRKISMNLRVRAHQRDAIACNDTSRGEAARRPRRQIRRS